MTSSEGLYLSEIERQLQNPANHRTHIAKELKVHLDRHKRDLLAREERIRECERKLEKLINGPFTNLYDLRQAIENEHQREALQKLEPVYSGSEIYLTNYEKNTSTDRKKQGIEGCFTILGTLKKDGIREEYEVRMYKLNANDKGTFWCSCPDHKFNSTKKNMVCKHICFLVCRVGKMLDPRFFNTKKLTSEQYETFKSKVENIHQILQDRSICRPKSEVTDELFTAHTKPITDEDICPICYDGLQCSEKEDILSCPTCANYVHKGCMAVWLERKDSCVYCRCDSWKLYCKN